VGEEGGVEPSGIINVGQIAHAVTTDWLTGPASLRSNYDYPMGKSQSKLTPEQLSDLQKNTYCPPFLLLSLSSVSSFCHSRQA